MITIRRSSERGQADHGWLLAKHTFSFAHYYDENHMGFRALRVINEDRIAGGTGFGTHPHRDMEIITWILEGDLRHRDSMGNTAVLRPGDTQVMSAGTGITHSEFNDAKDRQVRLIQIWIEPDRTGIKPGYADRFIPVDQRRNRLSLIASQDGRDGSARIQRKATIAVADLDAGTSVEHRFADGRHGWVQVASGSVTLNGIALGQGDGAAMSKEAAATMTATAAETQVLVFDLD